MAKRRQGKKQDAELETELTLENAFVYPFSRHRDPLLYPAEDDTSGSASEIPNMVRVKGSPQSTVVERQGDQSVIAKVAAFDSIDVTVQIPSSFWDMFRVAAVVFGKATVEEALAMTDDEIATGLVGGAVDTSGTTPSQLRRMNE